MKRKSILTVCGSLCCVLAIAFALYPSALARNQFLSNVSDQEMKNSLMGAVQVQLDAGRFESQNGLAPAVDSVEYQDNIQAFNQDVDLFYAVDNPCREMYKGMHEELLGGALQNTVGYTVNCGILDCEIIEITPDENGSDVIVEAQVSGYSTWIEEESNTFKIRSPLNVERIKAKMTLEENSWKLLDIISSDMLFMGTVKEAKTDDVETALTAKDVDKISHITEKEYSTFAEALAAAQQINMK
ncbi:MAG: hypothetical protein SOR61_02310 [Evtepia sp.]|uniref:hypothetical protein n=1 Tax=Evtepia sp. TaxID=2773933 RepID=UPI002A74EE68|nr:hypothetical protein [Evtepia sp.]MDY3014027.1 hypothetical protein [Evtepia sp.]